MIIMMLIKALTPSWLFSIRALQLGFSFIDFSSHRAASPLSSSAGHRPWSKYGIGYIWNFCGIVGRFHLLGLSNQLSLLFIQSKSFLFVVYL